MMRFFFILFFIISFTLISSAQVDHLSLYFAGDAMQHKSQLDDAKKGNTYDYSKYFKAVEKDIKAADLAIVNLETPIGITPYSGYPNFSAPIDFAQSLKDAGFNVFLTSNNHAVDKGKRGIERTIAILDSLQVLHTGTFVDEEEKLTYYPLMIMKNGIRIAFLNYTYATNGIDVSSPNIVNPIDTKEIKKDIEDAKILGADIIIANMHWGIEYKLTNNKEQERLANFLIDNGVRIVMGCHPHVVQPVNINMNENGEIENIIVYSLGNYISGMRTIDTAGGMSTKINLHKTEDGEIVIDEFDYDLVWTYKPLIGGKFTDFQLIKVSDYLYTDEGEEYLGKYYNEMEKFAINATKAIEKNGIQKKEPIIPSVSLNTQE